MLKMADLFFVVVGSKVTTKVVLSPALTVLVAGGVTVKSE